MWTSSILIDGEVVHHIGEGDEHLLFEDAFSTDIRAAETGPVGRPGCYWMERRHGGNGAGHWARTKRCGLPLIWQISQVTKSWSRYRERFIFQSYQKGKPHGSTGKCRLKCGTVRGGRSDAVMVPWGFRMKRSFNGLSAVLALVVSACQTTSFVAVENVAKLNVSFAEPVWNGVAVPKDQVCKRYGGEGAGPRLKIENVPTGTNAIIVSYNDKSFAPMDNGGHGVLQFSPVSSGVVVLPSVAGETNTLPDGVTSFKGTSWGAYIAPCSGGRGNLYTADIQAVSLPTKEGQPGKLIGEGSIKLGEY